VPALPVVPDPEVLEDPARQLDPRSPPPPLPVQGSTYILDQNDSIIELSWQSPTLSVDGTKPEAFARSVNAHDRTAD
jgi:hypothetical protein